MAIDLGDPYPLAVFITDDLGAAANAGTVAVTVTRPDLTVATPSVTNDVVGAYTASYLTTQAGRHTVRWVATGTNACTYSDDFNVVAADAGLIISLEEARKALGTRAADTIKDEDLRSFIIAATPIMEDIVGPILRTTRIESYDGGTPSINVLWSPMISISGITESYGSNYQRILSPQDIFAGSGSDAYGYTADLVTGVVTRRAAGVSVPFAAGRRNIQITYISGRTAVGGNILLATRRLIRHLWQSEQQGYRPPMGGPDSSLGYTPAGFAIPKAVLEMCAADTRPPGLA